MKEVVIAIDVDGTLIRNGAEGYAEGGEPIPNENIRSMLIALSGFKNTKIIVWSGGGEIYARMIARRIGLGRYVDEYHGKSLTGKDDKGHPIFDPGFKPDIAIDDIQSCELGLLNLIVREK